MKRAAAGPPDEAEGGKEAGGNMKSMKDLRGKVVLITGAASGIGRATAVEFAREGAGPLILGDIDEEGLRGTSALVEELGSGAFVMPADLSDLGSVESMVDEALRSAGRIDVLVNVAGIGIGGPVEALDIEDWRKVIGVNLFGILHTVSTVYPHMLSRGSGHIVNVASGAGLVAVSPYNAPYNVSKFGVVGFSESLQYEACAHGIGVSCVCPGAVRTPIYENSPIRGFEPEARGEMMRIMSTAEEPEDTARALIRAVKKNRFLVVTTPFMKAFYFAKKYLPFIWFPLMRLASRWMVRYLDRYRDSEQQG